MSTTKERRRRLHRPFVLSFIGICYITSPIFNVLFNSIMYNDELRNAFYRYDNTAVLLLLITPIVGLGILQVRPWGWYSFVLHSLAMLAYNVYNVFNAGNTYNYVIFYNSVLLLGFCAYFLRREISAPYFADEERGFRRSARQLIEKNVVINGHQLKTVDLSDRGLLANWPNCDLSPGNEVHILIEGDQPRRGGIVRIDQDKVGIAFRAGAPVQQEYEFQSIE